jgi:hypothetical protein
MLSVYTDIADQVGTLSTVQKAALVVVCAIPSFRPSSEMHEILSILRTAHSKLFSGNTLTPLGARWAYEANRQLAPEYEAIQSRSETDTNTDSLEELAFDGESLFGKLLEFITSEENEYLDVFDEDADIAEGDLDYFENDALGNSGNFEEEIIKQASRFQEMMERKCGVTTARFRPNTADTSSQKSHSNSSHHDAMNGASFRTHPVDSDLSQDPSRIHKDRGPLIKTVQPTVSPSNLTYTLGEISQVLFKSYGIDELPIETIELLTVLRNDPDLAHSKCGITKNSSGLVIKIHDKEFSISESQIMLDPKGRILNVYGLDAYYAPSKNSEW